jgi:hypothetical protein
MKTYSIPPYFDDFSEDKNFQQILFKPGFAVQARELTQLQTILRGQIEKFGNHIFQQGSVVIPGNSRAELNIPYVKLQPTFNSVNIDSKAFDGQTVIGASTGIEAIVKTTAGATLSDPDTLYIVYTKGSNGLPSNEFETSEEIFVKSRPNIRATLLETDSTGFGALVYVNRGVYFVNGSFVLVDQQVAILSKYTTTPSASILLKIVETLVESDTDESLLDPANGSFNYAAPGADRVKISLELVVLPLTAPISSDFVQIMKYQDGILLEQSRHPKYNELERSLARRTFDESGNYISFGYSPRVTEDFKSRYNNGHSLSGSKDRIATKVTNGKAYIQGFEVETLNESVVIIDKARTLDHIESLPTVSMVPSFGQYLFVTDLTGMPDFRGRENIDLFNAISTLGDKVKIGSATVIAIDYHEPNTTTSNAIYKLFVSDILMTAGGISSVGSVGFSGGKAEVLHKVTARATGLDFILGEIVSFGSIRRATVGKWDRSTSSLYLLKHLNTLEIPIINDGLTAPSGASSVVQDKTIVGSYLSSSPIIKLPTTNAFEVKTGAGTVDISYKVYREVTIATNASGAGTATVSGLTIDPIEAGNFIISSASGILSNSIATLSNNGLSISITDGPVSGTLRIVCAGTKLNQSARSKVFVSSFFQTGLTPANIVQLNKADVYRVISVVSTIDGDVTSRFTLDNGQRDFAYLRGRLNLRGTLPAGTLTVTYSYFTHSGSGDYFSVDSYALSGLPDYYDNIPIYISNSTSESFDLRNCLDFRARIGDNGTYTAGSAAPLDLVQVDSRITTSMRIYVGRIDSVIVGKSGIVEVLRGIPSLRPVAPSINDDSIKMAEITIGPYTKSLESVNVRILNNKVYTMRDIGLMEKRINNVEKYAQITHEESLLLNTEVIDAASGLNRFKSGYLVENFNNLDIIADFFRPGFTVTYTIAGEITAATEQHETNLQVVSTTGRLYGALTNGYITANFTEVEFCKQPVSTKITNINPFNVVSWVGKLSLVPSLQTFTDIIVLPPLFNHVTNVIVNTVTNVITTEVINVINQTVDVPRAWGWEAPPGAIVSFGALSDVETTFLEIINVPSTPQVFNQLSIAFTRDGWRPRI